MLKIPPVQIPGKPLDPPSLSPGKQRVINPLEQLTVQIPRQDTGGGSSTQTTLDTRVYSAGSKRSRSGVSLSFEEVSTPAETRELFAKALKGATKEEQANLEEVFHCFNGVDESFWDGTDISGMDAKSAIKVLRRVVYTSLKKGAEALGTWLDDDAHLQAKPGDMNVLYFNYVRRIHAYKGKKDKPDLTTHMHLIAANAVKGEWSLWIGDQYMDMTDSSLNDVSQSVNRIATRVFTRQAHNLSPAGYREGSGLEYVVDEQSVVLKGEIKLGRGLVKDVFTGRRIELDGRVEEIAYSVISKGPDGNFLEDKGYLFDSPYIMPAVKLIPTYGNDWQQHMVSIGPRMTNDVYVGLENTLKKKEGDSLTEEEVLKCLLDGAKGLVYMHARGYIHRDIKMENIFYKRAKDGTVSAKLADLDFAVKEEEVEGVDVAGSFFSPEVKYQGKPQSKASDIWAFGWVLGQLLSVEFFSDKRRSALKKVESELRQKDPEKRPDAKELVRLLGALLETTLVETSVQDERKVQ